MNLVADQLEINGYRCDAALDHNELIPFVKTYIFKRNNVTLLFLALNLAFLLLLISVLILNIYSGAVTVGNGFTRMAYGLAITFLLVPFHELLHGIAYRLCGAKNVSYKANWRKLYFMAIADKFVTGRREFHFIGFTPFVVISAIMLFLAFISSPGQQVMWLTVLLVHASMCAGDFGLMSYFAEHKNREVVTFDDVGNGISCFYSKEF